MKYSTTGGVQMDKITSLPVRGAWVEISGLAILCTMSMSLPVRGAWVEMLNALPFVIYGTRRSPCGERGLKFSFFRGQFFPHASLPVRGAWVEIYG